MGAGPARARLWEPVPGCWSIRPTGPGGRGQIEQAWPDPEPAPVTTIAWRLSHLAVGVFGLRASHLFGDGSLTHANAERPLTAKQGVAYFTEQARQWRSHIERLTMSYACGQTRGQRLRRNWTAVAPDSQV